MSRIDTSTRAREVIAAELGRTVQECRDEATLTSLGADSLDHLEVALELEGAFDIDIRDEDLGTLRTVGDFIYYVAGRTE